MTLFRLSPQAAAELDDIWYYVAKESRSEARADRLIDALTARVLTAGNLSAYRAQTG